MPETLPVGTGKVYGSDQELLDALMGKGWVVTGTKDATKSVPNTNRTTTSDPATIEQKYGRELTIQNADGTQRDKIVVNDVQNPAAKGGVGIQVLEGPTKNAPAGSTNKTSDPSKFIAVHSDPTDPKSPVVAQWDPVNNEWHASAQPGAKATGKLVPAVVTDSDGTQRQIGYSDEGDPSIFRPMPSEPSKQPTGKYDDVTVTDADGTKRIVGKTDQGDHSFHPVAADPTTGRRIIQTPEAIYFVDANGNLDASKTIAIDKNTPFQAVNIDGTLMRFDPSEKDPTKALVKLADAPMPKQIKDASGNPMILETQEDGTAKYVYPPGVTKAGALQTNTTAKTLDWYDDQGNLLKSIPNKNYVEPKVDAATPPATNLVAKQIQIPDPDHPGKLIWVDNKARVTASQALQNLATQLTGQVVDGDISVDEAKALIETANAAQTNLVNAAKTTLDYTSEQARTGAGLLQQRAATAQGMLSNVLGIANSGRLGNVNMSGIGAGLTGGIAAYTAELMGGQDTMNAAANMVRAASPGDAGSPSAAAATSALTQMLTRYNEQTNTLHPIQQAYKAAQQSLDTGGAAAPLTTPPVVQPVQGLSDWQRADQAQGTAPAGNALAPAGVAGTVLPGSPQYLGFKAPAALQPFAQSGIAEGTSRGFVAPPVTPPTPTVSATGQPIYNINIGG